MRATHAVLIRRPCVSLEQGLRKTIAEFGG